jgi:tetratricopeptide (TPR) repeat protein
VESVKKLILFLFLVLGAQIVLAQNEKNGKNSEAGVPYNEGNTLVKQQKYAEAIDAYKKAVQADPQFQQAY